jgi:predicted MFS family arabinose efflux permease
MSATALPRAGAAAWSAVLALGAVAGLTQLLWLSFAPIATEAAAHYGVSTGTIGWLTNVFPAIYVVLALPAGIALDRWPRSTMAIGGLLTAAGALTRIVVDDYATALTGQILVSIAQPILLSAVVVIATRRLPATSRASGIAVGSAGVFLGLLLGIAMPAAVGADHLTGLLQIQAAMTVAGVLWLLATLGPHHERESPIAPGIASLKAVLGDPAQRVMIILALGGFGTFVALLTWLQALLEPDGISDDTSGLLLLVLVLAGMVTTLWLPPLVARQERERTLLRVILPLAGVACLVLALSPPLWLIVVVVAILGALLMPALPVLLEIAERRMPGMSGSASSLIWLAGNLGGFAVALVVQLLLDSPAAAFIFMAAFTLAVGAFAFLRVENWMLHPEAGPQATAD